MKIKKTFFALIAVLAVVIALSVSLKFKPVYAEEVGDGQTEQSGQSSDGETETSSGEQTETPGEDTQVGDNLDTTESGLLDKIAELTAKINSLTNADYFVKNILPLITGAGSAIIGFVLMLFPTIRNNNKYRQLQGFYTQIKDENETLKTLLTSTDIPSLKDAFKAVVKDEQLELVDKFIKETKINEKGLAGLETDLSVAIGKINALISAAQNVWAKSPEAMAALTEAPERGTLVAMQRENDKLKDYIRQTKGEEAEAIIEELGV